MVHLNYGLSVGTQPSIVLNDGILQMLTMCLKSLKASKKLYAVGEPDIDFSKNLDVEK